MSKYSGGWVSSWKDDKGLILLGVDADGNLLDEDNTVTIETSSPILKASISEVRGGGKVDFKWSGNLAVLKCHKPSFNGVHCSVVLVC